MANQQQPIYILPEGYTRQLGRDAQRNNIMAAKLVAETVRTTLGPKGMDKMIVDSIGDIIVTNDGVTILEEMQIEHPAAKMLVEVAKTQENEVGDGTTTAVVLAGEFLKKAEALLDQEIHPTVIARGYHMAAEKTQEILNRLAVPVTAKDEEILKQIAMTAMTGKGAEASREILADLLVRAVKQITDGDNIEMDNIKIEKKVGGGIENAELIEGIVLDKERVHPGMPTKVKNAKIALLDVALEIKNTETDAKIQISSPDQMEGFLMQEEKMIRDKTNKVIKSGATVVICQKGIDDLAQHYLSKAGIYACRRVKKSDMEKLGKATGASIIMSLEDLSEKDLGHAGLVEELKVGDEQMTYVRECKNPKAVTFLVRGGTQHVVDEVERAVKDALGDIIATLKVGKAVGGAGAIEIAVAREIRQYATQLAGREQFAVLAFADALEIIPRTLAENAGLDPIDLLTELKAQHDKGNKWASVDVFTGKVTDAWKAGVIEPLKIKTQAIKSASEVAELILRIDDVIAGSGSNKQSSMPPGMGGMQDM
ncbi:TCP-1/cpn60 chaperonin family protein [Candidatus Woesearchaeota archaeon]|nr:TCP-1/cpn60 chaperonin family protein [Candidatus Woesearchaeota archaeon]